MKKLFILAAVAALSAGTAACYGETQVAAKGAYYGDKPAHITCAGYTGPMVDADTTGRIEYDEGGRYTFVNAKTGELTITEGECVVVYQR